MPATSRSVGPMTWSDTSKPEYAAGMFLRGCASGVGACERVRQRSPEPARRMTAGQYARMLCLGASAELPVLDLNADGRDAGERGERDEEEHPTFRHVHEPRAHRRAHVVNQEAGEKDSDSVHDDGDGDRQ